MAFISVFMVSKGSVVNTKLRDYYHSLDALCDDMNVNKEEIISALKLIDYAYDSDIQQFV